MNIETATQIGIVESIAHAKSREQLVDLGKIASGFRNISPKTTRRFERKYKARMIELTK